MESLQRPSRTQASRKIQTAGQLQARSGALDPLSQDRFGIRVESPSRTQLARLPLREPAYSGTVGCLSPSPVGQGRRRFSLAVL
nr:putative integron gene cassette protein [uncultured bacterium]